MKQEKWILRGGRASKIQEEAELPYFIAKVIASRLGDEPLKEYLNKDLPVFDPAMMADMDKAAQLLASSFQNGIRTAIVGDYDADGMTSSSILYLGFLRLFPSADLVVRIPDRVKDGYGFSLEIAKELLNEKIGLIITCDNGIREFATASFLKEHHIPLIITDHHEIETNEQGEDVLPEAACVINPHRQEDHSPFDSICGAFVAYQLIRYMAVQKGIDPEKDERLLQLKGYAAIGTVCDVMPLVKDNRRLVHQGLSWLEDHPTVGIKELMHQGGVSHLDPYTVGFVIGPMINSGGRLSSQEQYLTVLTGEDRAACREKALELYALNKERQNLTDQGIEDGLKQLETHPVDIVKVIFLQGLHESIAGLVAGKLKEKTGHPVFVITESDGKLKGSGRSVEAYHMFNKMNEHPQLFEKFGGHALAAGFTLNTKDCEPLTAVEKMRTVLNESCGLKEEDLMPVVYIDAAVPPSSLRMESIKWINLIGPFGTGNAKPMFAAKNLRLIRCQIFGKRRNVMRLRISDGREESEAIFFAVEEFLSFIGEAYGPAAEKEAALGKPFTSRIMLDIVYQAEVDEYYGVPSVRILLRHYRQSVDDK